MKWTTSEKLLWEADPPLEEYPRYPGATHDYLVVPMVKVRFHHTTKSPSKVWEPRRPWHTGKQRRPAYWMIVRTVPGGEHTTGDWDTTHYPTKAQACREAEKLAKVDKTRALLKGL